MKIKDKSIKVSNKVYEELRRLKKETKCPIKYIIEQAILLEGKKK